MGFTSSGDHELAVEITASDEGASGAFDDVANSARGVKTAVLGASGVLAGAGVMALAKATQAAAEFEQAMVEVEKVTNPETARQMSDAIRDMATEIPLAQKELAKLTADAARFGIRGPENIRAFTESVAKMAEATNLSADEAGKSLAKLAELTNTPVSEIENLGSAINSLSNNFATSSQEIVDSMLRSSGALSQLGLNQKQIAGLSASLNEVSSSSRRAGTRLRRVAQEIMNPKNVEEFASAMRMTTDEFRGMRQSAPSTLILEMAEAMKEGGKQADGLRRALSTTSRQALAGLAQNLEGSMDAMERSNDAYEEGESLQREFEAATDTFNAQLQLFQNRLRNVAIVMGNRLLPILTKLLKEVTPLVEDFAKFNKRLDGLPGIISAVTATLGGLTGVIYALGISITGTLAPAIAIIGALAGAGYSLYKAWDTNFAGIRTVVLETADVLKQTFQANRGQFESLGKTLQKLRKQFGVALSKVKSILKFVIRNYTIPLIKELRRIWKANFSEIASEAVKTFQFIYKKIKFIGGKISTFWQAHGDKIMRIAKTAFDFLVLTIGTAMDTILTTIKVVLALIRGDWKSALGYLEDFATRTFNRIEKFLSGSFLKGLKATMKLIVAAIKYPFEQLYNFLIGGSLIPKTFNEIVSFLRNSFLSKLKTALDLVLGAYKDAFGLVRDAVQEIVNNMADDVLGSVGSLIDDVLSKVQDAADDISDEFSDAIPDDVDVPDVNLGSGGNGSSDGDDSGGNDSGDSGGGDGSDPYDDYWDSYPELASGGIVDSATMAKVGEAGTEAVIPLNKLNRYLDTAYEVGRQTAPVGTPSSSSSGGSTSVTARLRVDGDGALAELIRENAEVVLEEHEQDKRDRISRL
jgi:TP901 family phage tail tape measure protein